MSTDAIVVLRQDHKEIKRLFRSFEKAEKPAEKQKLVKQILQLLAVHTYIENEGLYPQVRKAVPDIESDILESYEEHHVADLLCAELAEMTPDDERFTAKVTVLIESVEHHIEEEESSWFPDVREALGRKQLQEIGAEMLKLRKKAPKQPKRMRIELAEPQRATTRRSAAAPSAPALPTQADRESRPSLTPPPLPGATGDIEVLGASLPGAQTQPAAQRRRPVRA